MTNYVSERTAKIIEEIYNSAYIDDVDAEAIEKILKDELIEYHNEVFTYGHNIGYDDGYTLGYDDGYSECHSEGYSEGYEEGYADGYAEGYDNSQYESDSAV